MMTSNNQQSIGGVHQLHQQKGRPFFGAIAQALWWQHHCEVAAAMLSLHSSGTVALTTNGCQNSRQLPLIHQAAARATANRSDNL